MVPMAGPAVAVGEEEDLLKPRIDHQEGFHLRRWVIADGDRQQDTHRAVRQRRSLTHRHRGLVVPLRRSASRVIQGGRREADHVVNAQRHAAVQRTVAGLAVQRPQARQYLGERLAQARLNGRRHHHITTYCHANVSPGNWPAGMYRPGPTVRRERVSKGAVRDSATAGTTEVGIRSLRVRVKDPRGAAPGPPPFPLRGPPGGYPTLSKTPAALTLSRRQEGPREAPREVLRGASVAFGR